jgi:hypothetical protein
MVQADPLGHYYQPGRELAPTVGGKSPESPEIVGPKLLQDAGISVHYGVVVAAE